MGNVTSSTPLTVACDGTAHPDGAATERIGAQHPPSKKRNRCRFMSEDEELYLTLHHRI